MKKAPAPHPTVVVVDDDDAFRDSLIWLLSTVGHRVAGFSSAEAFLAACPPGQPGCLLLDVRMPGLTGIELHDTLHRRGYEMPVVFITGHGDVPMAVSAMQKGAVHFLEKPFSDSTLIGIIAQALAQDSRQRRERADRDARNVRLARLTPREREVLGLVVAGTANKAIAQSLGISIKTVEVHRARVMAKLEMASLAELVQFVVGTPVPAQR